MKMKTALLSAMGVMVAHGMLLVTNGYERIYQADVPMHIFGGFSCAILALALHQLVVKKKKSMRLPVWYQYLFVIGVVMIIGVVWEFHEFILDVTVNIWYHFPKAQPSLADTMKDLLDDWIGGTVAFFLFYKQKNK